MAEPSPERVAAGRAFYTKRSLAVYDVAILGYFSRVACRCPARRLLDHYNTHVSANNLDVGVGTGYFIDRCTYPATPPRLALMDLNTACLNDDLDGLGWALAQHLTDTEVIVVGCVGLFSGRVPEVANGDER